MKKKILIITGDPNSINSEIIYKCWKSLNLNKRKEIFFISNIRLLEKQMKKLNYPSKFHMVKDINENVITNKMKIINIDLKFNDPFNVSTKSSSIYIKKSLNLAHELAIKNKIKGIINCPIDKRLLKKDNQGITEYLASKCNIKDGSEVMLIRNKKISVSPITTHLNLKDVSKKINRKLILKKISTINDWFIKIYKKKPKIAVLGLNPHNAELRNNSEEKKIIIPSLNILKKKGYKIFGPFASDTFFVNDFRKYNVIVGMYHDQILAPFKTLFKFDAINLTLGLKYYRLSPDHGVAKNILKKKVANPLSLSRCIEFLIKTK